MEAACFSEKSVSVVNKLILTLLCYKEVSRSLASRCEYLNYILVKWCLWYTNYDNIPSV
jgi:hypothetical protein